MDVEKGAGHQPFDLYLVFDVEATCTEGCDWAYPNEIIEFPVVLVDGRTHRRVDEFHAYVRPSLHPTLSDFCKNLTGIKQETVDAADTFPVVLARFEAWLSKYAVHPFQNVVFVCDGPWDVRDFIRKQCEHSLINRPSYLVRFVDLRMLYVDFYQRERTNLSGMLNALGMEFQGREHSGQDDTRNIARIVEKMMQDGCKFVWNRECKLTRRRVAKSGRVLYTKADGPIPKGHSILF
ncbi:3'-5' exoribonuclease 1 [Thoreauomyces humboldtii]|nr:3'-5' exoribonuclease 1 [Thoreauomyces humboldtii]